MRFTKVGDLAVVTQITGPTHHLLGMALTDALVAESPILERVSLSDRAGRNRTVRSAEGSVP